MQEIKSMIDIIRDRTIALMDNFRRTILTADLNSRLYNQPLWKHIYHALYWFDYWYCTPENYLGAKFHMENLHSLDIKSDIQISEADLLAYFESVKEKTVAYLDNLNEKMLDEIAKDCEDKTRFACILGQFAHCYTHLGNVNAMTIEKTNKWVYIPCRECDTEKPLFEE